MMRLHGFAAAVLVLLLVGGCVRRTLTIETEPQGAIVVLNDQEIGTSPASIDFTWYGDYDVVLRKPGFQTLHTHTVVRTPWYQMPPIDFFFDVLWPGRIHDHRRAAFTLEPWVAPDPEEVVKRANELRKRALADPDKKPI
jgi:PEGA domain